METPEITQIVDQIASQTAADMIKNNPDVMKAISEGITRAIDDFDFEGYAYSETRKHLTGIVELQTQSIIFPEPVVEKKEIPEEQRIMPIEEILKLKVELEGKLEEVLLDYPNTNISMESFIRLANTMVEYLKAHSSFCIALCPEEEMQEELLFSRVKITEILKTVIQSGILTDEQKTEVHELFFMNHKLIGAIGQAIKDEA